MKTQSLAKYMLLQDKCCTTLQSLKVEAERNLWRCLWCSTCAAIIQKILLPKCWLQFTLV